MAPFWGGRPPQNGAKTTFWPLRGQKLALAPLPPLAQCARGQSRLEPFGLRLFRGGRPPRSLCQGHVCFICTLCGGPYAIKREMVSRTHPSGATLRPKGSSGTPGLALAHQHVPTLPPSGISLSPRGGDIPLAGGGALAQAWSRGRKLAPLRIAQGGKTVSQESWDKVSLAGVPPGPPSPRTFSQEGDVPP